MPSETFDMSWKVGGMRRRFLRLDQPTRFLNYTGNGIVPLQCKTVLLRHGPFVDGERMHVATFQRIVRAIGCCHVGLRQGVISQRVQEMTQVVGRLKIFSHLEQQNDEANDVQQDPGVAQNGKQFRPKHLSRR